MSDWKPSARQKQTVFERAGGRCEYRRCPADHSSDYFSVDHVRPRTLEGTNAFSNLALACQGCNTDKSAQVDAVDPVSGNLVPLYHPRTDVWGEHFSWTEDFTRMIGRTPTGRATVEALQLNRLGLVNLRDALRLRGVHPAKL